MTWTGRLNSRRVALGVKVNWAYASGEVKVLASSDGANFEEVKCWQSSSRKEVAFDESFMFDEPRNVKAVTITMRSAQSWGYFGINSVALIAEPGTFMLARLALSCLHAGVFLYRAQNFRSLSVVSHRQRANNVLLQARLGFIWNRVSKLLPRVMAGRSCNLGRSSLLVKVSFAFWVCSFAHLVQGGQIVNVAAGTCLTLADGET